MPRKQIWSGAVLAAVAASSLTGCSLKASDGTPQSFGKLSALSAPDALQAAVSAVAAHPSAKVHAVLHASSGASETADLVGTFDEHPTLQGTQTTAQPAPDGTMSSSPAIQIRYTDGVIYMNMGGDPQLAAQMNGKQWLKLDQQALATDPNTASYASDLPENTSPSKGLTLLAAAKDLHRVGEEQKGGQQTVHYAGTLTGADATDPNLAGRNHLTAEDADTVSNALGAGRVAKLGYDLWLGAGGLPVAMTFSEATETVLITGEIDYTDWGTKVDVSAIPDDQSADFMAMAKQQEAAQAQASSQPSPSQSSEPSSASSSSSAAPSSSSSSDSSSAPSTPSTPETPSTPAGTDNSSGSAGSSPTAPATPSSPSTPSTPSAPKPTGSTASSTGA